MLNPCGRFFFGRSIAHAVTSPEATKPSGKAQALHTRRLQIVRLLGMPHQLGVHGANMVHAKIFATVTPAALQTGISDIPCAGNDSGPCRSCMWIAPRIGASVACDAGCCAAGLLGNGSVICR
jgi:hypothetical protein